MGETWQGRKLGTLGDVGFFSLGRGKAFSAVEGGVILTDRDDIAAALRRRIDSLPGYGPRKLAGLILKAAAITCFSHPALFWIPRALPFLRLGETFFEPEFPMLKMSSFQAGLTARWRTRLQEIRDARRSNVQRWSAILGEGASRAGPALEPPFLALLRLPLRIRDAQKRKALLHESARRGRGVMPSYPGSVNHIPQLNGTLPAQSLPIAESCAREIVTLPTHGYLTEKDVAAIRRLLAEAFAVKPS
jgi:dTDP-4-amino-4,6-dideoxygalactose transaminase